MLLLQKLLLLGAAVCIPSRYHRREDLHQACRLRQAATLFRKVNHNRFQHRHLQRSLKDHRPKLLENRRAAFLRNYQCPLNPDLPRDIRAPFPRPHKDLMARQALLIHPHRVEVGLHMLQHLYHNTLFSLHLHIKGWLPQKELALMLLFLLRMFLSPL